MPHRSLRRRAVARLPNGVYGKFFGDTYPAIRPPGASPRLHQIAHQVVRATCRGGTPAGIPASVRVIPRRETPVRRRAVERPPHGVYAKVSAGTNPAIRASGFSRRLHLMRVFFPRFRAPRSPRLRAIGIWTLFRSMTQRRVHEIARRVMRTTCLVDTPAGFRGTACGRCSLRKNADGPLPRFTFFPDDGYRRNDGYRRVDAR